MWYRNTWIIHTCQIRGIYIYIYIYIYIDIDITVYPSYRRSLLPISISVQNRGLTSAQNTINSDYQEVIKDFKALYFLSLENLPTFRFCTNKRKEITCTSLPDVWPVEVELLLGDASSHGL